MSRISENATVKAVVLTETTAASVPGGNPSSGEQKLLIEPSTHHVNRLDSTGAEVDIETGSGTSFSNTNFTATGTGGNGYFADGAQASDPAAPASTGWVAFADSGGYWAWRVKNGSDTFKRTFNGVLTAARVYGLPDATGIMVLDTYAQTLTNKTLTSPVLNTGVSGTAISTDSTFASPSDTILASQKATKTYIDNAVQGLSWKSEVQASTAAALASNTYVNGSSGVGATLTGVATGVLTVDGHTVALNDRILVKNEVTASHNGIYLCTVAGAIGVAYVLTRSTDCDDSAEIPGAAVYTQAGTANANTAFVCSNTTNPVIGTDAITFAALANSGGGITQLTGDVTAGPGGGSQAATLAASGITAGTWTKPTFNAKGLATSGANLAGSDLPVMVASGASHAPGAAPDPGSSAGTAKFLREDASWAVPSGSFSSPLTTKGDLLGYDTADNRIPIGSNGQVLTADSTQALGLKWATGGGSTAVQSAASLITAYNLFR